jgi:flagellar transcriptional activator FlhD
MVRPDFPLKRQTVNDRETLESMREFNISYLMLAQHMLNEDFAEGMFKLGLSAQMANLIQMLSPSQTVKLAQSEDLVCDLRFDDAAMLSALTTADTNRDLSAMHAAILLAAQPAKQFC